MIIYTVHNFFSIWWLQYYHWCFPEKSIKAAYRNTLKTVDAAIRWQHSNISVSCPNDFGRCIVDSWNIENRTRYCDCLYNRNLNRCSICYCYYNFKKIFHQLVNERCRNDAIIICTPYSESMYILTNNGQ